MKNKTFSIILVSVMVLSFVACGTWDNKEDITQESYGTEQNFNSIESTSVPSTEDSTVMESSEEIISENTSQPVTSYEDNFAVPIEDAEAFAKKIQSAVATEDLEAFADLTAYPVYVSVADESVVNNREELIALGTERLFTPELKESIENADLSELNPSMAGFNLCSDGGRPNIIFGVQNATLGICGINY